jgi:hypothetical protein
MEWTSQSEGGSVETRVQPSSQYRIAYLSRDFEQYLWFSANYGNYLQIEYFEDREDLLLALQEYFPADAILAHVKSGAWDLLDEVRENSGLGNVPFIVMVDKLSPAVIKNAKAKRADDIFAIDFATGDLLTRLHYFTEGVREDSGRGDQDTLLEACYRRGLHRWRCASSLSCLYSRSHPDQTGFQRTCFLQVQKGRERVQDL